MGIAFLVALVTLSIVTFRYEPRALRDDAERVDNLNSILPRAIQEQGRIFLSGTILRGRPVLRCCFVNFRTTELDVDEILDAVRAVAPM